ncbi:MAG: DUF58 domain-containing protein [Tahibacter sp.]
MNKKADLFTNAQDKGDAVCVRLDELIAQRLPARALVLAQSRKIGASRSGVRDSRFRGRGVDYVESRAYQPGDDIRNMDWRVTARSGKPHTKLFQEERERSVLLVVDHNATMQFGTRVRFKSVQAARAAAFVAWSAVRGGDRIGAVGFGGGVVEECKPAGGPRGALRSLRAFTEWDERARSRAAESVGSLSEGLQRTHRLARPGSLILVFTDGYSADAESEPLLARLARHGDVRIVLCGDPIESNALPAGRYAIALGTLRRIFDAGDALGAERWTSAFRQRRTQLVDQARRLGISITRLETNDELSRCLAPLGLALAARTGTR